MFVLLLLPERLFSFSQNTVKAEELKIRIGLNHPFYSPEWLRLIPKPKEIVVEYILSEVKRW